MLKKKIRYIDYNDTEREEEFYFNMNEAEVNDMLVEFKGGMAEYIDRIVKAENYTELLSVFKDFIYRSYGVKSEDGKRFVKSKEISESFMQTEAYVELYKELTNDSKAASAFVNAVLPNKERKASSKSFSIMVAEQASGITNNASNNYTG